MGNVSNTNKQNTSSIIVIFDKEYLLSILDKYVENPIGYHVICTEGKLKLIAVWIDKNLDIGFIENYRIYRYKDEENINNILKTDDLITNEILLEDFQFYDSSIKFESAFIHWYELKLICKHANFIGITGGRVTSQDISTAALSTQIQNDTFLINGDIVNYFTFRFIGFNEFNIDSFVVSTTEIEEDFQQSLKRFFELGIEYLRLINEQIFFKSNLKINVKKIDLKELNQIIVDVKNMIDEYNENKSLSKQITKKNSGNNQNRIINFANNNSQIIESAAETSAQPCPPMWFE